MARTRTASLSSPAVSKTAVFLHRAYRRQRSGPAFDFVRVAACGDVRDLAPALSAVPARHCALQAAGSVACQRCDRGRQLQFCPGGSPNTVRSNSQTVGHPRSLDLTHPDGLWRCREVLLWSPTPGGSCSSMSQNTRSVAPPLNRTEYSSRVWAKRLSLTDRISATRPANGLCTVGKICTRAPTAKRGGIARVLFGILRTHR
jgi:hypothetical protein